MKHKIHNWLRNVRIEAKIVQINFMHGFNREPIEDPDDVRIHLIWEVGM